MRASAPQRRIEWPAIRNPESTKNTNLVTVPVQRGEQALGQPFGERACLERQAQADVVQHDQQDRKAAQQVDARIARNARCCVLRIRHELRLGFS